MIRPITSRQLAFDVSIAAACILGRLAFGVNNVALGLAVVVLGGALAVRRLSPALALAIAWLGAILQMYAGAIPDIADLAIPAVLYATARYGDPAVKWFGLGSAVVGSPIASFYLLLRRPGQINAGEYVDYITGTMDVGFFINLAGLLVVTTAVLGFSWTVGLLVRTRAISRDNRTSRLAAEQVVVVEQERNRIARDMHDVVAHSLAVVIAQADGARYARAADPNAVDEALTTISTTAREALADVRVLLGQLRHSQDVGPQPALADLDRLLEQLRSSGLLVVLEQRGDALTLPTGKQLALYRIVQEALTNALRHGDVRREVTVLIDWSMDAATLTITNANAIAAPVSGTHGGHGLAGMRERALLVGGTFSAGPEGGSFVVRASIPAMVTA